jgi:transcriptional regulator with XRE-family HTH domain
MNREQFNYNLGNAVRDLRVELSLTQEQLAEKADLSRNYISAVERGERGLTVYSLYRILSAVDVPFEKFIQRV